VFAPVDATIDCNTHQLSRGVILGEVLETLEGAKQKIIVLDACRDNPMGDICPPLATPPTLSFRDFKQALASSERAIAIDPEKIEYQTNRAHALMFLGRPKAAEVVYLKYKGRPLGEAGNSWDQQILEDFEELKKRGLAHPQMTKIKRLLSSKAPVR